MFRHLHARRSELLGEIEVLGRHVRLCFDRCHIVHNWVLTNSKLSLLWAQLPAKSQDRGYHHGAARFKCIMPEGEWAAHLRKPQPLMRGGPNIVGGHWGRLLGQLAERLARATYSPRWKWCTLKVVGPLWLGAYSQPFVEWVRVGSDPLLAFEQAQWNACQSVSTLWADASMKLTLKNLVFDIEGATLSAVIPDPYWSRNPTRPLLGRQLRHLGHELDMSGTIKGITAWTSDEVDRCIGVLREVTNGR